MSFLRILILLWGVGGTLWLLFHALARLTPMAITAFEHPDFGGLHWVAVILWVGFMAYSEGYKGFQQKFSPMVVARGQHLMEAPRPLHVLLAPVFCMGLFHATRRRLIVSWGILIGVAGLVLLIRLLDQPWRGIIDAGVVVGLGWGSLSILYFLVFALRGDPPPISADLPVSVMPR